MKREKLSQNEEFQQLQNRMRMLDAEEMPYKPNPKNTVPFDIAGAKYLDKETERIHPAANSSNRLVAVPKEIRNLEAEVIYEGWQYTKHRPLKHYHFIDQILYYQYRSMRAKQIAEFYLNKRSHWWEKKAAVVKAMLQLKDKRKIKGHLINYESLKKSLKKLEGELQNDK